MASLPKPLIGLLLGTVALFAVWTVALKPSSSSSSGGGSQGGVGQYQSAINKAHQAVTTSNQANAKLGAPTATTPAPTPATPAKATPTAKATAATPAKATTTAKATPAAKAAPATNAHAAGPATPLAGSDTSTVQNAVRAGKVVAVLFYNPAAADDQAMKHELAAIPTHGGAVVKLAVPVSRLTQFGMITQQVPVVTAPTLVLIDAAHKATTITGYADPAELGQRIDDSLTAK
jgi:hypothetical protein